MIASGYPAPRKARTFEEQQFRRPMAADYVCTVWFERDRANVRLETPNGRTVFDLWDHDVLQAIEDGFLTTPSHPRPKDRDWQPHAVAYALSMSLIELPQGPR